MSKKSVLTGKPAAIETLGSATVLCGKFLQNSEHIHPDWIMEKEYPLSKDLLAISRVFSNTVTREQVIAIKGAPEAIFDLCHLDRQTISDYEKAVAEMASEGLRVLGVARANLNSGELPSLQHDFDLEFVGLIGLSDPIRKNVPDAVRECYKVGIRVIMITGDYPVTAINIGKEIGIKNSEL